MELLKKENSIVCILLYIMTLGLSNALLAYNLKLLKKGGWYTKCYYWIPIILLSISTSLVHPYLPFITIIMIINIQFTILIAEKLEIGGEDLYTSPYFHITCLIIPLIGWSILISMYIFLTIYIFKKLFEGEGNMYVS